MRYGLLWGIAIGIALCVIVMNGWIDDTFTTGVHVIRRLFKFLGALGWVLVPLVLGAGLLIGREWSERARGAKEADDAWNRRNAYRKG
jgi:hypothetical protein